METGYMKGSPRSKFWPLFYELIGSMFLTMAIHHEGMMAAGVYFVMWIFA